MKNIQVVIIIAGFLLSAPAFSQIDIKGKIKNQTNNRANEQVDQGIDKGLNKVEEGIGDIFKKKEVKETEEAEIKDAKTTQEEGNSDGNVEVTRENDPEPKPQPQVKIQSYTKYDFVAGDKVLFFEDFSQDEVGDFPALWTTTGSGEIRTLDMYPGKWLYMNAQDKVYCLMKDLELPENFIFEFDVIPTPPQDSEDLFSFYFSIFNGTGEFMNDELYPQGTGGVHISIHNAGWEVTGYKDQAAESLSGSSVLAPLEINKLNHVIVWVQKRRLRIYHLGQKVIDLPTVLYDQIKYNRLRFSNWGGAGLPYVTNLRFTTAAPDTRSKLLTEGKLISYGIYFDSGKDIVKPESYGALNDIAKVLKENPAVRIKIVGHTDSDGNDATNLDLSKRRATSVKNEMEKNFGIETSRIETDGKGESQPIAPNTNAEGKAQNRRVEFIKL